MKKIKAVLPVFLGSMAFCLNKKKLGNEKNILKKNKNMM